MYSEEFRKDIAKVEHLVLYISAPTIILCLGMLCYGCFL